MVLGKEMPLNSCKKRAQPCTKQCVPELRTSQEQQYDCINDVLHRINKLDFLFSAEPNLPICAANARLSVRLRQRLSPKDDKGQTKASQNLMDGTDCV